VKKLFKKIFKKTVKKSFKKMKAELEQKFSRLRFTVPAFEIEHLRANVLDNYNYFCNQKSSESLQLSSVLQKLNKNLEKVSDLKTNLQNAAQQCDYDENTPGNGFWSYFHNFSCALKNVRKVCMQLTKNRDKMLFNKKFYSE
jgi:hypothetical protein